MLFSHTYQEEYAHHMTLELHTFDYLPPGFLDCSAKNLHHVIPGPSLIHLQGKKQTPLFVSILQHGNETVGLYAIQQLLKAYKESGLPRSISIFVGNVEAAREGVRRLDWQPDYNRLWLEEGQPIEYPEARIMQKVIAIMQEKKPFASIDLHSNTGLNPHYACINKCDNRFYHLAILFSKTVVYFIRPAGVQSIAFAKLCPSVTLECGHLGDQAGITHAFEFIDACIQLADIPATAIKPEDMDLFHTVATVKVPKEFSFSFSDSVEDIYFNPDLEKYNFKEVAVNAPFAITHPDKNARLEVLNEAGEDVFDEFFSWENNEIRIRKRIMPSMITLDKRIIRQDCLCYLMQRIAFS